MITDTLGRRIFRSSYPEDNAIYAFGDSQLLGYDDNQPHHLSYFGSERDLILHAAPNNGPFEYLNWLRISRLDNANGFIFGFNLSTDIFRILPGWRPSDHILLDSESLTFYYKYPLLFYLKGIATVFSDSPKVSLQSAEPGPELAKQFTATTDAELNNAVSQMTDVFRYSLDQISDPKNIKLLIYEPFWASELSFENNIKLGKFIQSLGCAVQQKTGAGVYFASPNKRSPESLSLDRRHWKQSSLTISRLVLRC